MPQYDAFLSYARKDEAHADGTPADYTDPDDSFVKRLYDALTAAELKIWWDRAEMPARGKPFLDEVRDLMKCAILSSGAIASCWWSARVPSSAESMPAAKPLPPAPM